MNFTAIAAMYMSVLLGWGVSNVGIGVWRQKHPSMPKRFFWQMNAGWGLVNTVLASIALYSIFTNTNWSLDTLYQFGILHTLSVSMGYNILFVIFGIVLFWVGSKKSAARLKTYAWAVFIQAGFLIIFDSLLYAALTGALAA